MCLRERTAGRTICKIGARECQRPPWVIAAAGDDTADLVIGLVWRDRGWRVPMTV